MRQKTKPSIKQVQTESQKDGSFPTDGHPAILNKKRIKIDDKQKSGQIMTMRINHNRRTALGRSIIYDWRTKTGFLQRATLALGSVVHHYITVCNESLAWDFKK